MNKKLIFFYIAAALLSFVGAVFGLVVGTLLGTLLGRNAIFLVTGIFGAVVGATVFCLLFILLFWKREHTKTSLLLASIGCLVGGVIQCIGVGYINPGILLYGWTFPSLCLLVMNSFIQAFKKTAQ